MKKILSSSASTKTSLEAIRNGEAGLTEKRKNMLARVLIKRPVLLFLV